MDTVNSARSGSENMASTSAGLAILGAFIAIAGNLSGSSVLSLIGFAIFIPAIISYGTDVSEGVFTLVTDNAKSFNSIFLVIVIGFIGALIVTRANYVVNLLLLVGVVFVVNGIVKERSKVPPAKVEYRFVPRTFREEQEAPVKVSQIFEDMFTRPTPWPTGSFDDNQTNFIGKRVLDDIQYGEEETVPGTVPQECRYRDLGFDKEIGDMIKEYYESPEVLGGKYEMNPVEIVKQVDELRSKTILVKYKFQSLVDANDAGTASRVFSLGFDDQACKWVVLSMTNVLEGSEM